MTDLTKITTPFGLLDEETQAALKAHGGPFEILNHRGVWRKVDPSWSQYSTYRVKPTPPKAAQHTGTEVGGSHLPPKPREWWCVGAQMHDSEAEAIAFQNHCGLPIVHVREVLE